ncbi:MAG: sigma 54-interacting transcriptional regulator [Peptostreptococcaceae bacterium]|nr:sigma 54-interacting transcriptional regulator [Peptostreptococcaceae bacterium]
MEDYIFNVLASEVYSKEYLLFDENKEISEVVTMMLKKNMHEAFFKNKEGLLTGILTFKDLAVIYEEENNKYFPAKAFMKMKLITAYREFTMRECRDLMINEGIGRLPILENGILKGVIRKEEVRQFYYMKTERLMNQMNYLVHHTYEAICVIDPDGIVFIWNKSSERLYDIASEEIVGKHIGDYFPNAMGLKVLKTKKPVKNALHRPRKDSYVIINAFPIYIDGEFTGVVTTDRDVTEINNLAYDLGKANDAIAMLENHIKEISGDNFKNIIGNSLELNECIKVAKQIAKTETSILITGESGTGKEIFARAIHDYSGREGMFVPVNCSSIPSELFESEMFGYVEGAFTGARKKGKAGLFELANGGTIFLDEIAEMPLQMQAKLLRVLQERRLRRIGDEKTIDIDIRVISATNKNLMDMVDEKSFRDDLYYRLQVVNIELPTLKERHNDIMLLARHFLNEMAEKNKRRIPELDKDVINALREYKWKGNIRELKNVMEYIVVVCGEDGLATLETLPANMRFECPKDFISKEDIEMDLKKAVQNLEINRIRFALEEGNGNKKKAAEILNIPRTTLYYKMEQHKIK